VARKKKGGAFAPERIFGRGRQKKKERDKTQRGRIWEGGGSGRSTCTGKEGEGERKRVSGRVEEKKNGRTSSGAEGRGKGKEATFGPLERDEKQKERKKKELLFIDEEKDHRGDEAGRGPRFQEHL